MGTGTTDEGHAIPAVRFAMQYTAPVLPNPGRALDAFKSGRLHGGALDRSFAELSSFRRDGAGFIYTTGESVPRDRLGDLDTLTLDRFLAILSS